MTGLLTWEARGVTKRFDAAVTIIGDTTKLHLTGVFDTGALQGGEIVVSPNGGMAHVTDKFEADLALNEATGGAKVSEITNFVTQMSGLHGPPDPLGIYCFFSVDGSYEHITATTGEATFNPAVESGRADASVTLKGVATYPGGDLGSPTDNGCEKVHYDGGAFDTRVDFTFDRSRMTEPGSSITVNDGAGWTYTIEWRE